MQVRTWLLILAVALATPSAIADNDADRAKSIILKGHAALKAGRPLDAVELYKDAYAIHPHKGTVFNIAYGYLKAGKKRFAYLYFKRYLALESKGKRADASRKAIADIEKQLGKLDLAEIESELIAGEVPPPKSDKVGKRPATDGSSANSGDSTKGSGTSSGGVPTKVEETTRRPEPGEAQEGPPELYTPPSNTAVRLVPAPRPIPQGPTRPAPYSIPFRGLAPIQPHGLVAADLVAPWSGDGGYTLRIRGQANFTPWFGATVSALILSAEGSGVVPDQVGDELGNPELGVYFRSITRLSSPGSRWTTMFYGSVAPELNTVSQDEIFAPDEVHQFVARQLGNFNRLAHVSTDSTAFCMAVVSNFESRYLFARLAAEINLFTGPPGRVTMGRFDGDVGLSLHKLKLAIGSVTRVGGVIGQLAGTDDNVLQTLGGTASLTIFDDYRLMISAGAAVVSVGGERAFGMIALERDLFRFR